MILDDYVAIGKMELITEYITKDECDFMSDGKLFDCISCSNFENCYIESCERCNIEFAKSVNFGGYNTEEDFWEQLY